MSTDNALHIETKATATSDSDGLMTLAAELYDAAHLYERAAAVGWLHMRLRLHLEQQKGQQLELALRRRTRAKRERSKP